MPATVPITTFSGAAPPWSLLSLDANFAGIASALANPQIGIGVTADSGGVNALVATPNPAWSSYVSGTPITVIPANTNTGNTTLNVSGLGARSVLTPDGAQLQPGALQVGTPYLFICGTSTFVLLAPSTISVASGPGGTPFALRNRIINGDFRVDQRNTAQTVVTVTGPANFYYAMDRWGAQVVAASGAITAQRNNNASSPWPNPYYGQFTVQTAKASLAATDIFNFQTRIEGLNVADLLWGTAAAKAVTLSFWASGPNGAVLPIAIGNATPNRSYVTSVTLSSTPQRYTLTIPGDTAGTWAIDNSLAMIVWFGMGWGSNFQTPTPNAWASGLYGTLAGATNIMATLSNVVSVTDVQLEAGSVATPFERIGFDMQLQRCQRYLPAFNPTQTGPLAMGQAFSATQAIVLLPFLVPARVPPTGITVSNVGHFAVTDASATQHTCTVLNFNTCTITSGLIVISTSSNLVAGNATEFASINSAAQILFTGAEL